jgi:hypothetical protein
MFRAVVISEQRLHPRAQIELPVRLRWLTPFGYRFEISQTIDASRTGLLLALPEACDPGARVWVTMPFDPDETVTQPETPARVVRTELISPARYRVALEFESPVNPPQPAVERERRRGERVFLALPVTVRQAHAPWPEETMTTDISDGGLRFETARFYSVGDSLLIRLQHGRWARLGEIPAQVVRIEAVSGGFEQRAAIRWTNLQES